MAAALLTTNIVLNVLSKRRKVSLYVNWNQCHDIYAQRVVKRSKSIINDKYHTGYNLFKLMPSGVRYKSIRTRSNRFFSFFPSAIRLMTDTWVFSLVLLLYYFSGFGLPITKDALGSDLSLFILTELFDLFLTGVLSSYVPFIAACGRHPAKDSGMGGSGANK